MTVEEAVDFFENVPSIRRKMETLRDVGLSYIRLGQRFYRAFQVARHRELNLRQNLANAVPEKTVYILDEPTTGLHFADVHKLTEILRRLSGDGNTVIVIEHNLDVVERRTILTLDQKEETAEELLWQVVLRKRSQRIRFLYRKIYCVYIGEIKTKKVEKSRKIYAKMPFYFKRSLLY